MAFKTKKKKPRKPAPVLEPKTPEQAQRDCDWIAIYGWDWWISVVNCSVSSREEEDREIR